MLCLPLALMSNDAITFVYNFLHGPVFIFIGYIPRRGIDGTYGNVMSKI